MQPDPTRAAREARWANWMTASQAGDQTSYRMLLHEVAPLLRGLARRRLSRAEEVEDAVQDCLLTLHQARASWDSTRPFLPWLLGIARHRIADRLVGAAKRGAREMNVDDTILAETYRDPTPNQGEARVAATELRAAIERLPPGQRRALQLLKLGEMTLAEASRATGQSETALKVAVHRGIAALRRMMARDTVR